MFMMMMIVTNNMLCYLYLKKQLFALKYTLKHSLIKINELALLHVSILSDHPQGVVVPSWLSYLEHLTFVQK